MEAIVALLSSPGVQQILPRNALISCGKNGLRGASTQPLRVKRATKPAIDLRCRQRITGYCVAV
jgi:hypothetical protein